MNWWPANGTAANENVYLLVAMATKWYCMASKWYFLHFLL